MPVCVFDANVPWDLYKLNKLDLIMQSLLSADFSISMAEVNFLEMPVDVQKAFKKHQNVNLVSHDIDEFDQFRKDIREKSIILDKKDSAVLYTCAKYNASYVVSSDTQVISMMKKYAEKYNIKIFAYHIVDIITLLNKENRLSNKASLDIFVELYSKKEIPHLVATHGGELISDVLKREKWVTKNTESCTTKFNIYGKHILNVKSD